MAPVLSKLAAGLAVLLLAPTVLSHPAAEDAYQFKYKSKRQTAPAAPPQAPILFTHTPAQILAEANRLCAKTKTLLDKIATNVAPGNATFGNVYRPILLDEADSLLTYWVITFYSSVSTNAELRDASLEASSILQGCGLEASTRDDIFKLSEVVYNKINGTDAPKCIDAEDKYVVTNDYKGSLRNGLGLEGADRDKYKNLRTRLTDLELEFSKNLDGQSAVVWATPKELEGLPEDHINSLAKGTGENEGKVAVTCKAADRAPALTFVKDPEVRRRVYIGCETQLPENVPLIKETTALRDEAARLLGYPNHAALKLESKMAKDVETVNNFLNGLREKLTPRGNEEIAHMYEIKKKDHAARNLTDDGNFYWWDRDYYNNIVIETEYAVDQNKVAEYFPMENTLAEMLNIAEVIFHLHFVQLTAADKDKLSPTGKGTDLTWHEDVVSFAVWEADDPTAFVGYLYMDLYPRANKYGHFAEFSLQPGFLKNDTKTRHYPVMSLVCNFPRPQAGKPALLDHDSVVTFFHELGHAVHDLSGRTKYARYHGTATARDFVEAPSQMLENWMWTNTTLKALSKHYTTNEKMPDSLIEALLSTKHVMEALLTLRQLSFGFYDMKIHTPATHEEALAISPNLEYTTIRRQVALLKGPEDQGAPPDWSSGEATFGHLMGGYDAGYYGYLWSQVYSTDMFYTAFKANPMDPAVGLRYRKTVLEKGGSQDEFLTLEQFLGRPPNSEAFYEELGL